MKTINLLLIDDHTVIRDGIKTYFDNSTQFHIAGEASNGLSALDLIKENPSSYDIVITDVSMDEMDGLTFTERLSSSFPDKKIIVMSMVDEYHLIKKIMNAGACGYLLKNCGEDELKNAVLEVYEGNTYYSKDITNIIVNYVTKMENRKKPTSMFTVESPLSDREKEVLHLILKEYSNKEIADELFISPRTVDAHKRNILEKTGSKNAAGLAIYAIQKDLFEDIF